MYQVTFYQTNGGNEVVLDFIKSLTPKDRKVIGKDLKTLQFGYPLGMPLCRHLRSQIQELRSSLPSGREVRLLFFFHSPSQQIIVLHGFIKTSRTTPKSDIDLAETRKKEF
jgi:phage-related protein